MKTSIIIPAYNARNTIYKTLDSIKIQKNISSFEVVIVRDTGEVYDDIVNEYKKFYNIRTIDMPENGGPGLARQYGIDNTDSEYIVFIDADDYFYDENSLFNLMDGIKNADLGVGNFRYERDNEVTIKQKNFVWLHGKIYRRQFLLDNNIRFNDTRANEDNGFNRLILFHEPNIVFIDKLVYVYSENFNSITRKDNRHYKFTGLEWYAYNMNWAIKEAEKRNLDMKLVFETSLGVLVAMYFYYLDLYELYDVSYILKWSKELKNTFTKYFNKYGSVKMIDYFVEEKKKEYDDKEINYLLNFYEFLQKI